MNAFILYDASHDPDLKVACIAGSTVIDRDRKSTRDGVGKSRRVSRDYGLKAVNSIGPVKFWVNLI